MSGGPFYDKLELTLADIRRWISSNVVDFFLPADDTEGDSMTRKKAKAPNLPDTVYIVREQELHGDESYLLVHENYDDIGDGEIVAVYTLESTAVMKVTRELT